MKYLYKSEVDYLIVYQVGRFEKGIFETDSDKHAAILNKVDGVTCLSAPEPELKQDDLIEDVGKLEDEVWLAEMSVKQLRAYAKENKIKIPKGLRSQVDVLEAVLSA